MNQGTIYDKTIRETASPDNFSEFDDDNSLYKDCTTCGQGQYPFKHGICIICGQINWNVQYRAMSYSQTIAELYD